MDRFRITCVLLWGCACASAAAQAPDWLPDTSQAPSAPAAAPGVLPAGWRAWLDLGADASDGVALGNVGLDTSFDRDIVPGLQALMGARLDLDATTEDGAERSRWHLSLRELYLRHVGTGWWVEAGRINVRDGVAQGYNPSDFQRQGAIDIARTRDPQRLREGRLGTVQARAAVQWSGAELVASVSPALHDPSDPAWYDPRWGAVNEGQSQTSLKLTLPRWQGLYSNLLWQRRGDGPHSWGVNLNAALGSATVVYAEWAQTERVSSLALARQDADGPAPRRQVRQWATGLSYTTAARQTWTLEWQHNGAGLRRDEWRGPWQDASGAGLGRAFADAGGQSDPLGRDNLMLALQWDEFGRRDAELGCLLRRNLVDHSTLAWCEWRVRQPTTEWSVALSRPFGDARSEFGAAGQHWAVALRWRHYL